MVSRQLFFASCFHFRLHGRIRRSAGYLHHATANKPKTYPCGGFPSRRPLFGLLQVSFWLVPFQDGGLPSPVLVGCGPTARGAAGRNRRMLQKTAARLEPVCKPQPHSEHRAILSFADIYCTSAHPPQVSPRGPEFNMKKARAEQMQSSNCTSRVWMWRSDGNRTGRAL